MKKLSSVLILGLLVGSAALADMTIECGTGLDKNTNTFKNVEISIDTQAEVLGSITAKNSSVYGTDEQLVAIPKIVMTAKGLSVIVDNGQCVGAKGVQYLIAPSLDGVYTSAQKASANFFLFGRKDLGSVECLITQE